MAVNYTYPNKSMREGGCCSIVCSPPSSGEASASSPLDGVEVLGDSCGFTCILKSTVEVQEKNSNRVENFELQNGLR